MSISRRSFTQVIDRAALGGAGSRSVVVCARMMMMMMTSVGKSSTR